MISTWRKTSLSVLLIGIVAAGTTAPTTLAASSALKTKVLYRANFRAGVHGWRALGTGWSVSNGMATNSGGGAGIFVAPFVPHTSRYAITAKMRLLAWRNLDCCLVSNFGVVFRSNLGNPLSDNSQGLVGGVYNGSLAGMKIVQAAFTTAHTNPDIYPQAADYDPGHSWHTVRVEVKSNTLVLKIDGNEATRANNLNRYFSNRGLGLISYATQLQVSSFVVTQM